MSDPVPVRSIEVVGHGGAAAYRPSNSRPAMDLALEIGVDRIECDVRRAADGILVLVHDERLPPDRRRVDSLTTDELRRRLPGLLTLDELADLVAGQVPLLIDVKGPGYDDAVIAAVRRHRLHERSSSSSTHATTLRHLRRAFPGMRLGLSVGHWVNWPSTAMGRRLVRWAGRVLLPVPLLTADRALGLTEVMLQHRLVTRPLVESLHRYGRLVNAWTADDEDSIRHLVACGVDGIISNRPDVAQAVLRSRCGATGG